MADGQVLAHRRLLDQCHAVEVVMGEIYRVLAAAYREAHPSLAALFDKTADEEDSHAAQLKLSPRLLDAMIEAPVVDAERATLLLGVARALRDALRQSVPTPVESLRSALELEETFAEFHLENAFKFREPSFQRLFHAMMEADRAHVAALGRALADLEAPAGPK